MAEQFRAELFIDGHFVRAESGSEFETVDPATGQTLALVAEAGTEDVDTAVAAARRGLESAEWRDMLPAQRARLLWRLGDLIETHADELAELEARDMGQPLALARGFSVPMAAEHFRYYAGWVTKLKGETPPVSIPGVFHYTRREPVGVCALITPWNGALMIGSWKIAPALACGNTVILKPAAESPLSSLRLAELVEELGFPPGTFNVLTGGATTGAALVGHPGVDKVSFTGSTAVGREIAARAAATVKRVSLELGGKTPVIVAPDADIDRAAEASVQGALVNSGQVCVAFTRFFVDRRRVDEFAEKCARAAQALRLGPPLQHGTQLGPLVSEAHLEKVDRLVQTGVGEGAELVTGGKRADGELAAGSFYQPTVFTNVRDDMTIAREEIFGPVISILPYDDPDELAARANNTEYGLAASIWTRDVAEAHRLAASVRAGTVWVNMLNLVDAAAPFGGFKASGWGREMGKQALDLYTEIKSVWVSLQ
jgi:aldehyde dehydrogenase (NAD+)/betaine-aldehyde dehydrogenase